MLRTCLIAFALAGALTACNNEPGASLTVNLDSQMASGQTGTAVLREVGEQTEVSIITSGGSDTGPQQSHIHVGRCGSNGPILYPLNNIQGGVSTTTINAKLNTLTGAKNYINIHKSTNIADIQACGNIP